MTDRDKTVLKLLVNSDVLNDQNDEVLEAIRNWKPGGTEIPVTLRDEVREDIERFRQAKKDIDDELWRKWHEGGGD